MYYRTILVCFVGFILVKVVKTDSLNITEITFTVQSTQGKDKVSRINCDHSDDGKQNNKYTVLEKGDLKIILKHISHVNHFNCTDYNDKTQKYSYENKVETKTKIETKMETNFKVYKTMGTLWNCTVLSNKYNPTLQPTVLYGIDSYAAAYCYFKVHVRLMEPTQTILVNNMVLKAFRTDLSEKYVDFTAEYHYADGDVVNVICVNFQGKGVLTMEYPMADTLNDKFNSMNLSSSDAIGFTAKLHSGHNNSFMICTHKELNDYTKVKVNFFMRTEFNKVSIKINGMSLRPKLYNPNTFAKNIDYKYLSKLPITVLCEVEQADMKLVLDENNLTNTRYKYSKKEQKLGKQIEMSFYLNGENETLTCASDYLNGSSAEMIHITFSEGNFRVDKPPYMELPPNGTVMKLYDIGVKTRNVIFYEFEDDEILHLECGPLIIPDYEPVLYLQLKGTKTLKNGYNVKKNLTVTHQDENSEIVCSLMEKEVRPNKKDAVLKEITVILRKKVLTTTTTTTTTSTTTTTAKTTSTAVLAIDLNQPDITGHSSSEDKVGDPYNITTMAVIASAVVCIIVICISTVIIKLRKRNHSQGGPHTRNYENLTTPSETSIPAFPPQWESNYAVPVDRRTDDITYSVPFQEPALYSTPIPKNQRNKKQKPVEPTYAVLDVPTAQGRKNAFKETDDPNYSELYANVQEQCYAKVTPKNKRNNMAQDNNPYSYVTNEPSYANTGDPEPMYCEPAKAATGQYANLNNSHYANSTAQEHAEPTYCEPQKRRK